MSSGSEVQEMRCERAEMKVGQSRDGNFGGMMDGVVCAWR